MYAVIRTYSGAGAKELANLLEQKKADVEATLKTVSGLVSYGLIRSTDGCASVTVCHDKAGADQSSKVAGEWVKKNAVGITLSPPTVVEGEGILRIMQS